MWTLAGLVVVLWSLRLWGYVSLAPWLSVPVALLGLSGLVAVVLAWTPGALVPGRRRATVGGLLVVAALAALALWSYFQVFTYPAYGTDEIAFDQYAARLALHGVDPYLRSMAPAFPLFHVSPNGYTFTLHGRPVTSLSYPALAFEAYLPALWLGLSSQAAIWVDVASWAAGAVVLWAVLPGSLRPLAIVLASSSVYVGYAVGGVTDVLFVPLLVGAAAGWDRFVTETGPRAWRGPVLLGLASAVKQTPWVVVPFLLVGIALESERLHGARRALADSARYGAIALGAFLVPNLPYIAMGPSAWFQGIFTPFASHIVPAGQGLVALSLYLGIGGGSLAGYSAAAAVVLVVLVSCFAATYPAAKPVTFMLASIGLFFATRSFGSYLVMLLPATIAAATTTSAPVGRARARHWRAVVVLGALAAMVTAGFALGSPSPLEMTIESVHTTGQLATVDRVRVAVTNRTGHTMRPSFTVEDGGTLTAFWLRAAGPAVLRSHERAGYTLLAPSYFAMPSILDGFQVVAFGSSPDSVSSTSSYLPSTWRVALEPDAIDHVVRAGQRIVVRAEIVDRLDARVRVNGIPVYLGQIIYAQRGLEYSEASIGAGPPGETPAVALTGPDGVATFTVSSPYVGGDPTYFEANLVAPVSSYPYGYSPILAVRFGR